MSRRLAAATSAVLLSVASLAAHAAPAAPAHRAFSSSGRPDPRTPQLRRALALRPGERRAVWIGLDPRVAASKLPPVLSAEARDRRARNGVGILDTDRPIAPTVVARLRRAGARIRVLDRWSRSVSADVDSATAERIARLPEVRTIESVPRLVAVAAPMDRAAAAFAADTFYGLNYAVLQQLDIPAAHTLGYTGKNIRIGMLDTGFDRNHLAVKPLRVIAQRDFIWNDTIVADQPKDTAGAGAQSFHGTATLSILGGYRPGKLIGAAYGASFILAKTELNDRNGPTGVPQDNHADEDRWVQAAQWEDSLGVDIISSSLGYRYDFPDGDYPCSSMNGRTTKTSIAAAALARRRILLVNAMGNDGNRTDPLTGSNACTMNAPADADSIISAGAVDSLGQVAGFSSRGPTFDQRLKPELSARGVGVSYAQFGTTDSYSIGNGTSFATPLIAGAAALILEAWPGMSPLKIRDALTLNASRRTPDNNVGWGVPDVGAAILFPQGLGIVGASPKDALEQLTNVAPTFTWSVPSVLPVQVRYFLDVATDTAFHSIILTDTISNSQTLTVHRPIRPAPALYWRITAIGPAGITRRTATSGPLSMPRWVRLANLADRGRNTSATERPTLRWVPQAVPPGLGPMLFDVQILNVNGVVLPGLSLSNVSADSAKVPLPLDYNVDYQWRVIAKVAGVADTVTSLGTFVVTNVLHPPSTTLYQNFPNPFPRPDLGVRGTHIWFDLAEPGPVELAIYDMRGRLVTSLIPVKGCSAFTLPSGQYGHGRASISDPCVAPDLLWDGTDDNGHDVPRGVYLVRLRAGGQSQTRHIIYAP